MSGVDFGRVLRAARRRRGLTLSDVQRLSKGRFKSSVVGGYERGERNVSLQRFCELATLYRASPEALLRAALAGSEDESRPSVVIDLARLSKLKNDESGRAAKLAFDLKARRQDYESLVITLRSGDIDELALEGNTSADRFLQRLGPAVISRRPGTA